jgi:hypothetical protein
MRRILFLLTLLPFLARAEVYSVPGATVDTYIGVASDIKPSKGVNSGALFIESDTSRLYWWVGDKNSGTWTQALGPACETNALATSEGLCFTAPGPWDWEVVAASDTDEPCGTTGGIGDYLHELILLPAVAAAGAVSLEDGTGTNYTIHPGGGTTALTQLHPMVVPMGLTSALGAWEVTTGANVSVICKGRFDTQ